MNNIIQVRGLEKKFGEKTVLEQVDLEIKEGEIFGLLGPSGAGKTTLIKILTGQLKPTNGETMVMGKVSKDLTGKEYKQIGMMMDNFGVYERMNCYDNLKFYCMINGISNKKIMEMLKLVGLSDVKKTVAADLSKGMRNRLLLARVLLGSPKILFLDEPTSGLDPMTTEEIHKLIMKEKEKGTTIFLTTHNMVEAEKLCDHIALLNEGKIVEYGVPKEICRRYNHQKMFKVHLSNGKDVELIHAAESIHVLKTYLENGELETIHSTEPNLESVFMELTGRRFE